MLQIRIFKKFLPGSKNGIRNKYSESGLAHILCDSLTSDYNWDGIQGKRSLSALKIISSALFGKCIIIFCMQIISP